MRKVEPACEDGAGASRPALPATFSQLYARVTSAESIRLYACPLLVVQNSALFLVMKQSTSLHADKYHTTVAVFMQEVVKLLSCLAILIINKRSVGAPIMELWGLRREMLVLCIPAICYTGQNNLLYVGVSYLPAAVAQVLVQTKLLWASIFSIMLLGKRFSAEAWASFIVLVAGVVLVKNGDSHKGFGEGTDASFGGALIGMCASIGAAGLSGFAGVYLEKTFNKGSASLLQMNVWLALISMPLQVIAMIQFDRTGIAQDGLFFGFHSDTWGVILIQAIGGLLTAVVIKFAGNILKGFATAMALLSTSLIAIPMLGFAPSPIFWVGLLAVCAATMMYSTKPFTMLLEQYRRPPADMAAAKEMKQQRQHGKFNKLKEHEVADVVDGAGLMAAVEGSLAAVEGEIELGLHTVEEGAADPDEAMDEAASEMTGAPRATRELASSWRKATEPDDGSNLSG